MATQLPAPQNIRTYFNGTQQLVTCDEIAEASSYKIVLNGATFTRKNPQPSVRIGESSYANITYFRTVTFQAIGDGVTYLDSEVSSAEILCYNYYLDLFKRLNPRITPLSNRYQIAWNKVTESGNTNTISYSLGSGNNYNVDVTYNESQGQFRHNLPRYSAAYSYIFAITIPETGAAVVFTGATPAPPNPLPTHTTPTGLNVFNISSGSAVVSWNASEDVDPVFNSKKFGEYKLSYGESGGNVQTIETFNTSETLLNLKANTTYNIELVTAGDNTTYLDSSAATTTFQTASATPLSTPTGLTHSNVTSTSARVGWNAVENATDYKVEYRRQGDTTWNE